MPLCDVTVYTQFVHSDGKTRDAVCEEYVSTTEADHGEIIAALQVLYPTYVGCYISPVEEKKEPELHDYSDRVNK